MSEIQSDAFVANIAVEPPVRGPDGPAPGGWQSPQVSS